MTLTPAGLSLASRMVLEHLRRVAPASESSGDFFDCSMAECADELAINPRTVSRSLQHLQNADLISFVPGKGQRPTRVRFEGPPTAKSADGEAL